LGCDIAPAVGYRRPVLKGSQRPRSLAMLALCALLLRAWVPAGWMPAGAAGGILIEPCPAAAPVAAAATDHAMHHAGHGPLPHHRDEHPSCAFAGLALSVLDPPPAALPLAPTPTAEAVPAADARISPGRGLAAPPPPATGPPIA